MCKIHFVRENIITEAEEGSNLLDVWRNSGLMPDAPCGGRGICGKCRVRILGEENRVVKACETRVHGDMELDTEHVEEGYQILTGGRTRAVSFLPVIRKIRVQVPPGKIGECRSDWTRFVDALSLTEEGKGKVYRVNPRAASLLGKLQKETQGTVWAVISDEHVLQISGEEPQTYMAAVDIGTTTVAAYLLRGEDGTVCAVASGKNPQSQYGADVINRANYCLTHGMEDVTGCIRAMVNQLLAEMAQKAGISVQEIYALSVAGNTCMHHMFLGIAVDSLTKAPYVPAVQEAMICSSQECGIAMHPEAEVWMLPNIAGFVGADTVGCLLSSGLAMEQEWTLLVDIGTNGEMVLGKDRRLLTCSTAAGPAFEGAGITCGMRGASGAISHVRWNGQAWEYETIDFGKPLGICGSGILDLAAELLRSGQMDEGGYLEEEIILADGEESGNGEPIRFTQRDVRQLQLAKAAIAAGIRMLAMRAGIALGDIQNVLIAGAFGNFMQPESACAIGLIPQELSGKIRMIGNAAGEGAKLVLKDRSLWEEAQKLSVGAEFVELATMKEFQDCFVDEMEFN